MFITMFAIQQYVVWIMFNASKHRVCAVCVVTY